MVFDFKEEIRKLKVVDESTALMPWLNHIKNFSEYLGEHGLVDFLREPTINGTMFVGNTDYIKQEYKFLVENKNWYSKWQNAVNEPGGNIGNPIRFLYNHNTSGNRIHCAYHLAQFEEMQKHNIEDMEMILEIGGGYGSMCHICRSAGFTGDYVLFDLPLFSLLQKEYLSSVSSIENIYYTNLNDLKKHDIPEGKKTLVISTWALSEMPYAYMRLFFDTCAKFRYILFAYQRKFEGNEIEKIIGKFMGRNHKYSWNDYLVPTMDGNHKYAFGGNYYE